jgi:Holliday junction resolvase RusA-like endonuclease
VDGARIAGIGGFMIEIEIKGNPIAKARPRFARVGKFVRTYDPQETEESRFLFEVQKQWNRPPIDHPLKVRCSFEMPIPKGTSGKKRQAMNFDEIKHTKRPDISNLIKFVEDCLNGVVWKDDSFIVYLAGGKFYSDEPKTLIMIEEA